MEKNKLIEVISQLSNREGASGFENRVADYVVETAKEMGLGLALKDPMMNLYLSREGNTADLLELTSDTEASQANLKAFTVEEKLADKSRPLRFQLDAHMDEVSYMVQAILPNGCLKITQLGRWVASNIPAHRVKVLSDKGEYLIGLTTSKPPHFMSEEELAKPITLEQIVVDMGFSSKEECLAAGIKIGAPIVPDVECEYFPEKDRFIGKAFDCRSGCASILGTLSALKNEKLSCDVFGAFAAQEEVGTRGASVTGQVVKPDIAIVFEGCPADDTFGDPALSQTKLGHGPMLRHLDARMITHPGFQRYVLNLAEELGIEVQDSVRTGGSTNGAPLHLTKKACPCIVIGIPVRYIHTHYGYSSLKDHELAIRLASEIVKRMDWELFHSLY